MLFEQFPFLVTENIAGRKEQFFIYLDDISSAIIFPASMRQKIALHYGSGRKSIQLQSIS
jgi:hypothetical protein